MKRNSKAVFPSSAAFFLAAALAGPAAVAQITIEGVVDKTVYTDRVSLRVPAAAGYEITALLSGEPIAVEKTVPPGVSFPVDQPQFYQLTVQRRQISSGAMETRVVRFIVKASERKDSE